MECPDLHKTISIIGYIEEETSIQLLLNDDTTLTIDKDLLMANINSEEFDDWQQALDICLPLTLQVTVRRGHITAVMTE